jgi:SAM-dependent methyltransferase
MTDVLSAHAAAHLCPRCAGALGVDGGRLACASCGARFAVDGTVARLTRDETAAAGFDAAYFDLLARVEDEQFWFVSRRRVILDALRRHVPDLARRPLYDVGCGPGGLLAYLARHGVPVLGACDSFAEALALARRRVAAPLALVAGDAAPPLAPGVPLLGMFDVLEHIDDDAGTLRWAAGVLAPGGVLALTVPAHRFLFDEADRLAHHRRRYGRGELRGRLEAAGFEIRLLTHFMAPLVPLMLASRTLGRLRGGRAASVAEQRNAELGVVPGLNGLLRGVLSAERLALRWLRPPFGTSLIAIAARR